MAPACLAIVAEVILRLGFSCHCGEIDGRTLALAIGMVSLLQTPQRELLRGGDMCQRHGAPSRPHTLQQRPTKLKEVSDQNDEDAEGGVLTCWRRREQHDRGCLKRKECGGRKGKRKPVRI